MELVISEKKPMIFSSYIIISKCNDVLSTTGNGRSLRPGGYAKNLQMGKDVVMAKKKPVRQANRLRKGAIQKIRRMNTPASLTGPDDQRPRGRQTGSGGDIFAVADLGNPGNTVDLFRHESVGKKG